MLLVVRPRRGRPFLLFRLQRPALGHDRRGTSHGKIVFTEWYHRIRCYCRSRGLAPGSGSVVPGRGEGTIAEANWPARTKPTPLLTFFPGSGERKLRLLGTLAAQMYESRDYSAVPIPADALQDASARVRTSWHCRGDGPHVRGCWVVDLVLAKG